MRMRSLLLVLFPILIPAVADSAAAGATAAEGAYASDQAAVIQVVSDAYVDGIHNYRDVAAIRKGFHPEFEMLVLQDGKLEKLPLAKWIESIEAGNAKTPPPAAGSPRTTTATFPVVEVAGTAAMCEVHLSRGGRQVFTDFLLLYRFEDGWKIVGKSFYRH
jgi:hypothetical protein